VHSRLATIGITFPLPVCPYAKIVLLNPSMTDSVQPFTTSYTSNCDEEGPKTASYAHLNDFFPSPEVTDSDCPLCISATESLPSASSVPDKGRTRTKTLILSALAC
jgi:hypothetical protein